MRKILRLELTLWPDEHETTALNITYIDYSRECDDGQGHKKYLHEVIKLLQEQLNII